jgi:hypothetical protein
MIKMRLNFFLLKFPHSLIGDIKIISIPIFLDQVGYFSSLLLMFQNSFLQMLMFSKRLCYSFVQVVLLRCYSPVNYRIRACQFMTNSYKFGESGCVESRMKCITPILWIWKPDYSFLPLLSYLNVI